MPKLTWDEIGSRNLESGTDRGVLYLQDANGAYPEGVAWNGLTGVTESPSGADANDFWADNIKYASIRATETFGGTIEAYTYPKEFEACDGSAQLTEGVTIGQQSRATFGFCFRSKVMNDTATEADDAYKIHIIYGATASPSDRGYQTINDSPDAITFSWEISTIPVSVTGHKPTSNLVIDSSKVDATKLAALETVLYGGDDANAKPRLPLPDEIVTLLQ